MAGESFRLEENVSSKGYFISKKICVILSVSVLLVFAAVIIGLSVGLPASSKDCDPTNNAINNEKTTTTTTITRTLMTVPPSVIDYRLPKSLDPYEYNIFIKPQFTKIANNSFSYEGEVTISFTCVENTSRLIFHINKLLINGTTLSVKSLSDSSFTEIKGFSWTNDIERQFFVANLAQQFKANQNYSVFVQFTGYLTDDNAGFYRSSYLDNNQQRRWLLTSQMEPTDARKSFPCFDEPAMKAKFTIRVEHAPDYEAFSNMPVASVTNQ